MSLTSIAVDVRPRAMLSPAEIERANDTLDSAPATDIIAWAVEVFGPRIVLTASFADTLVIDLALTVNPDIEVVFLDTGFHFAETLDTARKALERYALNLTVVRPEVHAADVWADGSDACCAARKVAPLDDYLRRNADAWFSGLRRADSPSRADAPVVALDRRGLIKVNPIAAWTDERVDDHRQANAILINPLADQGYDSIGCWPCTEPASGRDGRWLESGKTECGLHL